MTPLVKTLVLVLAFFLCSDLLAQESGSKDVEPQERVVSFVEFVGFLERAEDVLICLLYTSPSPRDRTRSRMPSSA